MKMLYAGVGVALFLGVGCGKEPPSSPSASAQQSAVVAAHEIQVLQGNGDTITLESLKGQVVLVDFCATWSAPSRAGVAELNQLQTDFGGGGLAVLGLCVDEGDREAVSNRVAELNAEYSVAWADPDVQQRFGGIRPLPTRILLDRNGKEQARFEGAVPIETLKAAIRVQLQPDSNPQS